MFGVIAPTVRAGIKALCKSGVLKEYGIERLIRLSDRSSIEVYDLETIAALAFRIDGHIAKIEYIKTPNGEIYLTHTEVPRALGGKGVGSQLVEKALKDIEQKDLRLVPLCPFVAGYIHKHPEWRRIVMKGFHIQ